MIQGNTSVNGGGLALRGSNTKCEGNYIDSNNASNKGGGIKLEESQVFNNTILNNAAETGGGIFINSPSQILKNNLIQNNYAHNGGGIYFRE
ncbi:hypothetical protein KA005_06290, partial [bacterium]|nr:hypothetical protein [bacterium]